MMRGQKALYTSLFPSSITSAPENKSKRNVYIDERDDAMACRYYYHAQLRRIRYDDCLVELYKEFFLSPNVITQRLMMRQEFIKKLITDKATRTHFRKKYPHFCWV
jgi:hypothetical protein